MKVLMTGAAGGLGRAMRERFKGRFELLRLTDIAAMAPAGPGEEAAVCDLGDAAGLERLCAGIGAIIHFGGRSTEAPWETILQANITGFVNLYEAARKSGVQRLLFASSNHAIGFYKNTETIDHTAPPKPDSRYGLSKAFGEDLAKYYALKHGIRGLGIRIGSSFPEPVNARMLSTWLSYADLDRLLMTGLTADYSFEIVYGVSRNTRSFWDNSNAYRLGYDPQDNSEVFAEKVKHLRQANPLDESHHGGNYLTPDFSGRPEWF